MDIVLIKLCGTLLYIDSIMYMYILDFVVTLSCCIYNSLSYEEQIFLKLQIKERALKETIRIYKQRIKT